MIICPKCNNNAEDGALFCNKCGTSLTETTNAQAETATTKVAEATSVEVAQNTQLPTVTETVVTEPTQKKKFKISKKFVGIGSAVIALVLVASIVLSIFSATKKNNYVLYLKDDEIFYSGLSKAEPWQVTSKLSADEEEIGSFGHDLSEAIHLTDDSKKIFFPDKRKENGDGFSLYYKEVDKPDEDAEKLDSNVYTYAVSDSGKCVTYVTADDVLYQHDLKDKEKIASGVTSFIVSDDGKRIAYIDDENRLYYKESGKDKEKIDSDIEYIYNDTAFYTEALSDLSAVYYKKDNDLYKFEKDNGKEKIASDVYDIINFYKSGEIYYTKENETIEKSLMDYVIDDMAEQDDQVRALGYPEYPYSFNYDSEEEYEKAYDEYEKALDEYYEVSDRDELREKLRSETISDSSETLYYYDGSEEKKLTDRYDYIGAHGNDKALLVFQEVAEIDGKKIKLSEVSTLSEVSVILSEEKSNAINTKIAIKDKVTEIEPEGIVYIRFNESEDAVYFTSATDDGIDDLYKMEISGDTAKTPKLYDSDVYSVFDLTENDSVIYYKDADREEEDDSSILSTFTLDVYIDKQKIADDITTNFWFYSPAADALIYMSDHEPDIGYTLSMIKDKKTIAIAEDVGDYHITAEGDIVYLQDYSQRRETGDLYVYKNGKSEKLDEDVSMILPDNMQKYHDYSAN